MKKFNNFLNIVLWCVIGVFTGTSIYQYYDYVKHPELYELTSAPWYLSIQVTGLFTVIIVVIILLVKLIIKRKIK